MPQTHLRTAPPPTITACCPRQGLHWKNSGMQYRKEAIPEYRIHTEWAAPMLGVTGAAAGAHPSAVRNTFHALHVDVPLCPRAEQRGASVLELPFERGCLSPIPGRGGRDGASTGEGRPENTSAVVAETQPPVWSPLAAVTLEILYSQSCFCTRRNAASADRLLCQEEMLDDARHNEGDVPARRLPARDISRQ